MKEGNSSKNKLHPRNIHQELYDIDKLVEIEPKLKDFVIASYSGQPTFDFASPIAVKLLNKALLKAYYKIEYFELPDTNLCPPIPGRADYIHYIADLLAEKYEDDVPKGSMVKILDIGTGASLIYPILGASIYNWSFVASELDVQSIKTAKKIIDNNTWLQPLVELRKQSSHRNILKNIIKEREFFDVVICNPPFFKSREEALGKSAQKLKNLGKEVIGKPIQNFSGQNNELWCEGGELAFITNYMYESRHFAKQTFWFTSLVSSKEHLKPLESVLKRIGAKESKIISMQQGNKVSRILAWRF